MSEQTRDIIFVVGIFLLGIVTVCTLLYHAEQKRMNASCDAFSQQPIGYVPARCMRYFKVGDK